MRRLVRRIFTLCSAASLVVCVAACVLWVRSHYVSDRLGRAGPMSVHVQSVAGRIVSEVADHRGRVPFAPEHLGWGVSQWPVPTPTARQVSAGADKIRPGTRRYGRAYGFEYLHGEPVRGWAGNGLFLAPAWRVGVPHWFLAVVTAGLPAAWARRAARLRRDRLSERARHCTSCGYDLRATPGRCPECGTAAAAKG